MAGFIVIEGIDGCGKSTVSKAVAERFGPRAVLTREPTDSWLGRAVREGASEEVSPYLDALLFMADRANHTLEIAEHLGNGKVVVCDRYYHSTVAYQTAYLNRRALGDHFDWLLEANTRISIHPDITFLLTVGPEDALGRIGHRGELSRFEKADFLREVQENYLRLARIDQTIVQIDASQPMDEVVGRVLRILGERKF
ncbi:TPA: dTMP kinase [Thermoplasmata archaeon]|nr:dTMP kinase [Thermoplasmata archaeon]